MEGAGMIFVIVFGLFAAMICFGVHYEHKTKIEMAKLGLDENGKRIPVEKEPTS